LVLLWGTPEGWQQQQQQKKGRQRRQGKEQDVGDVVGVTQTPRTHQNSLACLYRVAAYACPAHHHHHHTSAWTLESSLTGNGHIQPSAAKCRLNKPVTTL
jgi:hypothetical protein